MVTMIRRRIVVITCLTKKMQIFWGPLELRMKLRCLNKHGRLTWFPLFPALSLYLNFLTPLWFVLYLRTCEFFRI